MTKAQLKTGMMIKQTKPTRGEWTTQGEVYQVASITNHEVYLRGQRGGTSIRIQSLASFEVI